jgi:hypothetical protein
MEPAIPEYISFTEQITVPDEIGDVGVPDVCDPNDLNQTGWDIDEVAFTYDRENDTLYVGISMANDVIAGDPENNGNPSTTDSCLTGPGQGGTDMPNLGGTEGIDVIFDTDLDGDYDYIAGVDNSADPSDITSLSFALYNGAGADAVPGEPQDENPGSGYNGGEVLVEYNNPHAGGPDLEYQIPDFADEVIGNGGNLEPISFCFVARAGSGADAGIGEDVLPEIGQGTNGRDCVEVTFAADYDFGDAPDNAMTILPDGARHILDGITYLGAGVDAETDGITDTYALGDDDDNTDDDNTDDEDGVTFMTALIDDQQAELQVVASTSGYLNAWVEDDGTVDFDEQILTDHPLVPGLNVVSFLVDFDLITDTMYARFRFTSYDTDPDLDEDGAAFDGEVEDYALMSLGNMVWLDNGAGGGGKNNGMLDGDEVGIPNVRVELYRGSTLMGTTETDATGRYWFYGLQPGNYRVRVRSTNFATGQPLYEHISSLDNGVPNDYADQDVDENGVDNADPAGNGVSSSSITLELGEDHDVDGTTPYTISNPTLDFGFVVLTPTIALTKTVYLGSDGTTCTGGTSTGDLVQATNGTAITYCFEVSNTSLDVGLNDITIDDAALGINQNDLTPNPNADTLAPGDTNYYYYVTTVDGDLLNSATVEGQPLWNGEPAIGLPDVTDTDTAEVDEVEPSMELQKTVYFGTDDGNSCPGGELVTNVNGADITYCLEITNTGDTYLDDFTLTDTLGITEDDLTLSGVTPLAPDQSLVLYYESEISGTLQNTAMITATAYNETGQVISDTLGGAIVVTDTDTAQVAEITPSVQIQKTVYQGHDNGASCAGDELVTDVNGANVTYCFTVTNNSAGNYLDISIDDPDLGITDADMVLLSGNLPLVPLNGTAVYYYETTINGDLENTATVTGNPVDSSNNDYPDVANVTDDDTAEVNEVAPAIEIEKTVYTGDNSGLSCPGSDMVTDTMSETLTYCFEVTNTGNTFLNNITINDADLGIDQDDMTLFSGGMPLTPSMSLTYYYTTPLTADLLNTATVEGDPSDADGVDLEGIDNVTDSDTAEVKLVGPDVSIEKTVYLNTDNGVGCETSGDEIIGLNGNAITYCFVVTNEGDTYLDDIDLDDNDLGIDEADMILLSGDDTQPLPPGESLVYYYETTILMDLVNWASVEANPTEADGTDFVGIFPITDTDDAKVDQVSPNVELHKTVSVGAYPGGGVSCEGSDEVSATNGEDVTYCFIITNTGDTYLNPSLTDASLGISLLDMTLISGTLPLAAGASLEYYYEAEVTGDLVNLAEVIANPVDANFIDLPNIPDVSDQDTAKVDEVSPGIELEKTVYLGNDGGASCQGQEVLVARENMGITYCFEVTNTSDTHLDVSIDDATLGITQSALLPLFDTPLAPGDSRTYFYQTTLSTDLINIATATGNPVDADGNDLPDLVDVDDMDSAEVRVASAEIELHKTVYADVDSGASCTGFNLILAEENAPITYCFHVVNTGNTHLNNITIDDDDLGIDQDQMTLITGTVPLAPDASLIYYYQTFVDGPLVNTAETTANPSDANGNDLLGIPNVSDEDIAEVSDATIGIDIQKTVATGANAACPGGEIVTGEDGDPITWCFVITNTGDTFLNQVVFNDPELGVMDLELPVPALAPAPSVTSTYAFTIPGAIPSDPMTNTASVVANPVDASLQDLDGLDNVSDEDTAAVGQTGMELAKTVGVGHPETGIICPANELGTGTEGTAVYYCFSVTNSGSTYLDQLEIDDPALGIGIADMTLLEGSVPLAPGETVVYYYKSLITMDLVNIAEATANPVDADGNDIPDVDPITLTDTAEIDLVESPDIALHKNVYVSHDSGASCPSDVEFVNGLSGTEITYCFEVENTGDTYLSGIMIDDADLGINQTAMMMLTGTMPLAPGASLVYYYEDTIDGNLLNTAEVTGTPSDRNGNPILELTDVMDSDTAEVREASSPDVMIEKTVYDVHDNGASCAGDELVEGIQGAAITYCFEVANTGDTYLASIMISDTLLSITEANMTVLTGTTPLAPGASLIYYYETTITEDMVNTAAVDATPSDETGADLGLDNVIDNDTAQVSEVGSPSVRIQKTVYNAQDSGASCQTQGVEFIMVGQNASITYCFEIENTGDTYLDDIMITDDPLSITQDDMTLVVTGSLPIAPGESATYYYDTTAVSDTVNIADVEANPTDQDGNDIAGLDNVTDSDSVLVDVDIPTALGLADLTANEEGSVSSADRQGNGYSLAVLLMLLAAGAVLAYKTILNKETQ